MARKPKRYPLELLIRIGWSSTIMTLYTTTSSDSTINFMENVRSFPLVINRNCTIKEHTQNQAPPLRQLSLPGRELWNPNNLRAW